MDKSLLTALHTQLETKQAEAELIASTFKVDDEGRFTVTTDQHRDYVAAVKGAEEVKAVIDAANASTELGRYLTEPATTPDAGLDAGLANPGVEFKTLGDMFVASDAYQSAMAAGFENSGVIRATIEGKSIFNFAAGNIPSGMPALGTAQQLPFAEVQRRKTHIRDLFPKSTTKSTVLYGIRELGWVNNAAQVKQRYAADGVSPATGADTDVFGMAPKSKILLGTIMYPVAEIAHTLDAHKNVLSDEARLKTFLNNRMIEGVKYREDYDLLHSVGDGERITGLFNTPGVQTYTALATDKASVQVRRAITKCMLAEYDPTGLVVSPTRWEGLETEEDKNGNFRVSTSVAVGAIKTVWHLAVVETTAIEDDKFLIGAFGMGAQLHDRESVSVTVSTENRDNYERGVVTFRADERCALEVPRPESFCIGTWTGYTGP